jgi:hypothetical protein
LSLLHHSGRVRQDRSVPDGSHIAPVRFEGFTFVAPSAMEAAGAGGAGAGVGGALSAAGCAAGARRLDFSAGVHGDGDGDGAMACVSPAADVSGDSTMSGFGSWTDVGMDPMSSRLSMAT